MPGIVVKIKIKLGELDVAHVQCLDLHIHHEDLIKAHEDLIKMNAMNTFLGLSFPFQSGVMEVRWTLRMIQYQVTGSMNLILKNCAPRIGVRTLWNSYWTIMFHRRYEVKVFKNKMVKQANDAKKAENEAI